MQEVWIWRYKQMVYAQPRICPRKWDAQNYLGFWHSNGTFNLSQTTRPRNSQQQQKQKQQNINKNNKKQRRTCRLVGFAVPTEPWVKLKKSKKGDKYLDLARELKKWNMKVTVILIVTGALRTKRLVQRLKDLEIRRREEIIQTTTLLISAGIIRFLET